MDFPLFSVVLVLQVINNQLKRNAKYHAENPEKRAKRSAKYYAKNKEKIVKRNAKYYVENKEKFAKPDSQQFRAFYVQKKRRKRKEEQA